MRFTVWRFWTFVGLETCRLLGWMGMLAIVLSTRHWELWEGPGILVMVKRVVFVMGFPYSLAGYLQAGSLNLFPAAEQEAVSIVISNSVLWLVCTAIVGLALRWYFRPGRK
ncbi:hypothetical protein [Tahibacter amnicola]|uniref:Uncharacterized protein n=1 Tax=Tahibacter amnicola TaxID=2976241 RepID=A0ABY6BA12_9GAMM|nr:hypothetical protein [Tahibacter amnicola]UXI66889.1 hypothetical protein N4264_19330 [Tahibacter amnicola]